MVQNYELYGIFSICLKKEDYYFFPTKKKVNSLTNTATNSMPFQFMLFIGNHLKERRFIYFPPPIKNELYNEFPDLKGQIEIIFYTKRYPFHLVPVSRTRYRYRYRYTSRFRDRDYIFWSGKNTVPRKRCRYGTKMIPCSSLILAL